MADPRSAHAPRLAAPWPWGHRKLGKATRQRASRQHPAVSRRAQAAPRGRSTSPVGAAPLSSLRWEARWPWEPRPGGKATRQRADQGRPTPPCRVRPQHRCRGGPGSRNAPTPPARFFLKNWEQAGRGNGRRESGPTLPPAANRIARKLREAQPAREGLPKISPGEREQGCEEGGERRQLFRGDGATSGTRSQGSCSHDGLVKQVAAGPPAGSRVSEP